MKQMKCCSVTENELLLSLKKKYLTPTNALLYNVCLLTFT